MYLSIVDKIFETNSVVGKVGYSYTVDKRERKITSELQCDLIPIAFKRVNAEIDEKAFHAFMAKNATT